MKDEEGDLVVTFRNLETLAIVGGLSEQLYPHPLHMKSIPILRLNHEQLMKRNTFPSTDFAHSKEVRTRDNERCYHVEQMQPISTLSNGT